MSFGVIETWSIETIREKLIRSGHCEFAQLAVREDNIWKVASDYESFLASFDDIDFSRSKPPGTIIFYILTSRVSKLFSFLTDKLPFEKHEIKRENQICFLIPPKGIQAPKMIEDGYSKWRNDEKFMRLATFASLVYPLLTYLVLIPLFYFSKMVLDEKSAYFPCILYLFIPSIILINMHLDQVIYPALFMFTFYLSCYASSKDNPLISFFAGVLAWFSLYFSFSLLVVIPFSIAGIVASVYFDKRMSNLRDKVIKILKITFPYILGFFLMMLIFKLIMDYNFFIRLFTALDAQRESKVDVKLEYNKAVNIIYFSFLSFFEFFCWIGIPIALIYCFKTFKTLKDILKNRKFNFIYAMELLLILFFLISCLSGMVKNESGRLWIFLIPFICIIVSREISENYKRAIKFLFFFIFLELVTTLFIKRFQDLL